MSSISFSINIDEKFIKDRLIEARQISFATCMQAAHEQSSRIREAGSRAPHYLLDDKLIAHSFAHEIGVKTPRIFKYGRPLEEIEFKPNTVVKPTDENSSRGVFIVRADGKATYLNTGAVYENSDLAKTYARDLENRKVVVTPRWMVEELIEGAEGKIARDVKFYMFYGRVALILETQRQPSIKRCWYDANEKIVDTGKYSTILFKGDGGLAQLSEIAKRVSLEIPAPFARIDLLQQGDQIYFGEVTPEPGAYHEFNHKWDSALGLEYIKASVRLGHDMGQGKNFSAFRKFERSRETIIRNLIDKAA